MTGDPGLGNGMAACAAVPPPLTCFSLRAFLAFVVLPRPGAFSVAVSRCIGYLLLASILLKHHASGTLTNVVCQPRRHCGSPVMSLPEPWKYLFHTSPHLHVGWHRRRHRIAGDQLS